MFRRISILAEGVTKTFGARTLLRKIDLAIAEGECVVMRGENGTGKTTLLRCLAGLVRPDSGRVHWFGHSPAETSAHRLIGMVAHESQLYPHLTLRENLVLAGRLHGIGEPTRRANWWLDAAELSRHAGRLPREVSQGLRRRTSLARAMIHDPPILLLDEPTTSLDDAGRAWLFDHLRRRQELSQTTCLVTHDHPGLIPIRHRLLELRSGRLRVLPGTSYGPAIDGFSALPQPACACRAEPGP
jgi:heme exporter protein A